MAFSPIRKATDEDFDRPEIQAYRRRLWACCMARALRTEVRVNLTIAYGYVGLSV